MGKVGLTVFREVRNQWVVLRECDERTCVDGIKALYVGEPTLFPQELVDDSVIFWNRHHLSDGGPGFHF